MVQPQVPSALSFSGRTFSAEELQLIQALAADFSALSLTELSQTVCELLQWKRPNGGLKNHECRLLLERLAEMGWVRLPALRAAGPKGPRVVAVSNRGEPGLELSGTAREFEPLQLQVIQRGQDESSRLWMELVERYHYLGYRVPVGANLRYLVRCARCPEQVLACLLWTSPAWRMEVRDRWIGWSDSERRRNLQLIVNNGRFLILPWVRVPGLASKILSRCSRQLPADWETHYGYRPLLLETLVDGRRFRGTCYQAANWVLLGQTTGRGRMDRDNVARGRAVKDVYVYPVCRQVQQRLRTAAAPRFCGSAAEEGG
jgi:hypothetical protein